MNQRGFSLIELLIALGIFAVVSAAALSVMRLATNADAQLQTTTQRLASLERFRSLMRADLLQIANRPYRTADTSGHLPPFLGGAGASLLPAAGEDAAEPKLVLVRNGWPNPDFAVARASLQHVTWLLTDAGLVRRTRPFVDSALGTPDRDVVILAGISSVEMRFLGPAGWVDSWQAQPVEDLRAVRIIVTDPELGVVTHDFLAAGALK